MAFRLNYLPYADKQLRDLESNPATKKKADRIKRAIGFLEQNPRHRSLQTHEFKSETGPKGEKMWQAYAETNTPRAWRVLFYYPEGEQGTITVYAIVPHPDD